MAYSSNPLLPKARKWAILLVLRDGLPVTIAATRAGIHRTTLWRWLRKWRELGLHGNSFVPTLSSRPHTSPRRLSDVVVARIRDLRERTGRCAPVLHALLMREGVRVSVSSVKRILKRLCLTRPTSPWKRYRPHVERPQALTPGALLQIDVVHFVHPLTRQRTYCYTLVDLHSRWAYAHLESAINQRESWRFLRAAQTAASFRFRCIQTDNGGEFGRWFGDTLRAHGMTLRHSRVRRPNDNAHIERFNRTLQDECLGRCLPQKTPLSVQPRLAAWLDYYNEERLHLGIQLQTPAEMLQRC